MNLFISFPFNFVCLFTSPRPTLCSTFLFFSICAEICLLCVIDRRSVPRMASTESRTEENPYDFRHLLRKTSQRQRLIKHYWIQEVTFGYSGLDRSGSLIAPCGSLFWCPANSGTCFIYFIDLQTHCTTVWVGNETPLDLTGQTYWFPCIQWTKSTVNVNNKMSYF